MDKDFGSGAPRGADFAIAGVAGVVSLVVVYLVGFVIAFAVAFRVTEPFAEEQDYVRALLPMLGVAALIAGFVGAWLSAWWVRRKGAGSRAGWITVAVVVGIVVVVGAPGLLGAPESLAVHLLALIVGAIGGGLLALRRRPSLVG